MDAILSLPSTHPSQTVDLDAMSGSARLRNPRQIQALANQFESVFASLLLKQMRATLDEGSFFASDPGDVMGGLFDQFMGDQLGRAGGLGIGAMVKRYLEEAARRHEETPDVVRSA